MVHQRSVRARRLRGMRYGNRFRASCAAYDEFVRACQISVEHSTKIIQDANMMIFAMTGSMPCALDHGFSSPPTTSLSGGQVSGTKSKGVAISLVSGLQLEFQRVVSDQATVLDTLEGSNCGTARDSSKSEVNENHCSLPSEVMRYVVVEVAKPCELVTTRNASSQTSVAKQHDDANGAKAKLMSNAETLHHVDVTPHVGTHLDSKFVPPTCQARVGQSAQTATPWIDLRLHSAGLIWSRSLEYLRAKSRCDTVEALKQLQTQHHRHVICSRSGPLVILVFGSNGLRRLTISDWVQSKSSAGLQLGHLSLIMRRLQFLRWREVHREQKSLSTKHRGDHGSDTRSQSLDLWTLHSGSTASIRPGMQQSLIADTEELVTKPVAEYLRPWVSAGLEVRAGRTLPFACPVCGDEWASERAVQNHWLFHHHLKEANS
eukprot:gnl/TRDRNA2_/TRDRNA2_164930_c0_seq1.p1 gnl/TRDRNA2_/TRDRNA2_164930_c0~~gnl/TRDRNA2_/TRDRNA2_164930_c0_seq1.p1  ORF type:complete len:432 (+),score=38.37 gnl/TRDRNA2_/TRDRNA2_164930_c0_seq1:154-1449(+)